MIHWNFRWIGDIPFLFTIQLHALWNFHFYQAFSQGPTTFLPLHSNQKKSVKMSFRWDPKIPTQQVDRNRVSLSVCLSVCLSVSLVLTVLVRLLDIATSISSRLHSLGEPNRSMGSSSSSSRIFSPLATAWMALIHSSLEEGGRRWEKSMTS